MKLETVLQLAFCAIIYLSHVKSWEINKGFCSKIYSKENYSGKHFTLQNNQQLSDFQELKDGIDPEWSNITNISFQIKSNCSLILSNEKFVNGDTLDFYENMSSISSEDLQSFACICDKDCSCDSIQFKSTECGRAYISKDCSRCSALYTSLHEGNNLPIQTALSSKIKSVVIKSGCHLTINNDNDFQIQNNEESALHVFLNKTVVENYSCQCSPNITHTNVGIAVNANEPNLIDMPSTKDQITKKLSQNKGHTGLIAGLESLKVNRSPKNAYILAFGLSGTGKSTTINFLFDHPTLTQVGNKSSTTKSINEFRIPIPLPKLGLKNTQIRIIDTPGISDTGGVINDAQFLATFEEFLKKHEELKTYKPNLILIVADFNDNRYSGENSKFVKMLRTIELFSERLIDPDYSNVVFVLTHFMSEVKTITRDPSEKLASIKKAIQDYSTLPNPISLVVAENKPNLHDLLAINGFYKLPNGEYYPQNLFTRIQRNLLTRGDSIGNAIIQSAFQQINHLQIERKSTPLLPTVHAKVSHYLSVLRRFESAMENTEISTLLNNATLRVDEDLKTQYPDTLSLMKRRFFRRGLNNIADLPRTTSQIVNLLHDFHLNPLSIKLLKEAFDISAPDFPGRIPIAHGYNIMEDRLLSFPILSSNGQIQTSSGFQMPSYVKLEPVNIINPIFEIVEDQENYALRRWRDLGISQASDELDPTHFAGSIKSGYNIINSTQSSLNALIEYNLWSMELNQATTLEPQFCEAFQKLDNLNTSNWDMVAEWTLFFDKYGTHMVKSAGLGGSIEVQVSSKSYSNDENSTSESEPFIRISEALEKITLYIADTLLGKVPEILNLTNIEYFIILKGGQNHGTEYKNLSLLNLQEWESSLRYDPKLLNTFFNLIPISEVVKEKYTGNNTEELIQKIKKAEQSLFNASLTYIPIEFHGQVQSRESSGIDPDQQVGNYEFLEEFAQMFQQMRENSARMQQEYINMITETQNKQRMEDKAYEKEEQRRLEQEEIQEKYDRENEQKQKIMKLQHQKLESERRQEESKIRAQMELNREQIESERAAELRKLNQAENDRWMNFILAENQRRSEIIRNRKPWYEKVLGFVTGGLL